MYMSNKKMYAYPIRARCVFADRASSMTPQRRHTGEFSTETLTTQRSCSSLAGCIISKALLSAVKSTPLSIWRNRLAQVSRPGGYHVPWLCAKWTSRQFRCSELVSLGQMLHVAAKIFESLRSLSTSGLQGWTQPYILVLDRRSVLPDQSVS